MEQIINNKWMYQISIKDMFKDETTPELIIKLCASLKVSLNGIKDTVSDMPHHLTHGEQSYILDELATCIDNFEFIQTLADGTIPKDAWWEYEFDGDFEEMFNDYMTQLYDLADQRLLCKNNQLQKFMWID